MSTQARFHRFRHIRQGGYGWLVACLVGIFPAGMAQSSPATDRVLENVKLPPGFTLEVYADNVPNARSMVMGSRGTLYVGTREDRVYAIEGTPGSGTPPRVSIVARGLNSPNGVAFRDGALYVAEINRILRFDGIETAKQSPKPVIVRNDLPRDGHHGWRYIAFGPDDKLYIAIGAPCNVCDEPSFGVIKRMNPDGSGEQVFARGVRNSVGFTWHPTTQELYFTDNGRDMMGDNVPPCELNVAPRAGLHFGFPFCHGKDVSDPKFGGLGQCFRSAAPVKSLGAHVAPLGLEFYQGTAFPAEYQGQVFIAEHGSWNRSEKSGYRVSLVRMEGKKAVSYEGFATGFHQGSQVYGRPVDLLMLTDGSMLLSDDHAGAIYRITYQTPVSR